jgi:hypothetical protein
VASRIIDDTTTNHINIHHHHHEEIVLAIVIIAHDGISDNIRKLWRIWYNESKLTDISSRSRIRVFCWSNPGHTVIDGDGDDDDDDEQWVTPLCFEQETGWGSMGVLFAYQKCVQAVLSQPEFGCTHIVFTSGRDIPVQSAAHMLKHHHNALKVGTSIIPRILRTISREDRSIFAKTLDIPQSWPRCCSSWVALCKDAALVFASITETQWHPFEVLFDTIKSAYGPNQLTKWCFPDEYFLYLALRKYKNNVLSPETELHFDDQTFLTDFTFMAKPTEPTATTTSQDHLVHPFCWDTPSIDEACYVRAQLQGKRQKTDRYQHVTLRQLLDDIKMDPDSKTTFFLS